MSIYNLDKIFRPSAIAVIGASEKEKSVGCGIMVNLLRAGYKGRIFPVNPHYRKIQGLEASPSIARIGRPVDLAVIATPISSVPSLIEECASAQIGGAIVVSAGGRETGKEGLEIEKNIKEIAHRGGVRVIGPNCLGVLCSETQLNASFSNHMTLPGRLAFVSQSGAICTAILDLSQKEHIGFSHFASIGSMLDVDFGDLINYLGNDPQVSSIALYIENLNNFRKFMSAARAVSPVKPIVVLKSGRSAAGARAAASHTGALAGEDAVYDAAFKRAGIVRVNTIEELFDCAELMSKQSRPAGPGIAVITNAGGPGVMAADALAQYGLEPAVLSPKVLSRLDGVLPYYWSKGNPIDILGDASSERYRSVVEICMSSEEVSNLLIILTPQASSNPTEVAETLCSLFRERRFPVFTVWMGAGDVEKGREIFNRAGVLTYDTPERAVTAFMYLYSYKKNLEMLEQIPPKLPGDLCINHSEARRIIDDALNEGGRTLTEIESKALLEAYGLPVNPTRAARTRNEASSLATSMGYPVVMKILSRQITHKSDANGVRLNLQNEVAVEQSFDNIMAGAAAFRPEAELLGVTVQPMLTDIGCELIIGAKKDADFGPVILFGMGGIMTEVIKDWAIALPPLNRSLARWLMETTKIYRFLLGHRNRPPANLLLIEEILIRLSHLVSDLPEIVELDMNPVIVSSELAIAVDARVTVEPCTVRPPMHLVISSYPTQHEMTLVTHGGIEVFIRPIKPEDAPLLVDLFNALSPTSIYFRFFRPLKQLSREMLARFTQIDYDRDIVLVALEKGAAQERMLGVVRLMSDPDRTEAEFAIVVGDPWHGKGIGAALLEHSLSIAKEQGIGYVWGMVLPENTTMIALGRKVGFSVARVPDGVEYELKIVLERKERGAT